MILDTQIKPSTVCTICWYTDRSLARIKKISTTRKTFWMERYDSHNPQRLLDRDGKLCKVSWSEKKQAWLWDGKRVLVGVEAPYTDPSF